MIDRVVKDAAGHTEREIDLPGRPDAPRRRCCGCDKTVRERRIYNPVTGKYYEIRQRSSKYGTAGQIKGLWSSKREKSSK